LLLEIGTEEIPADYLDNGIRELRRLAESYLQEARIKVEGEIYSKGTLRRLVLVGSDISEKQEDTVQETTGPPVKVAFDEHGNPTKAAIGFAQKQGVSVDALEVLDTSKGQYLYLKRMVPGRQTIELLSEIFPTLIAHIRWPKSMRWGSNEFSFVRPIHWIVALFKGQVIPFEVAGVQSGNTTRGHRFMAGREMEVSTIQGYLQQLREASVLLDAEERMEEVRKAVKEAAHRAPGVPEDDHDLLSTVTNMVEFPFATCGGFDESYLKIPEAVLITAMKEHQRYFSVRDGQGLLMPNFVAINNTVPSDEDVVRRGHERVLRARLADADFFFTEDRKRPLEDRLDDLKEVIYQTDLGTSFEKVERFSKLAEYIAQQVVPEKVDKIRTAARLCKCDLVTEMVMEFPSLQGTMGEIYARLDGQPEEISQAISDHYLPLQAESEIAKTTIGSIVGISDRMDTIVGCFAVGLEPTGTADPYALRRHAIAIIRIIRDRHLLLHIPDLVEKSAIILAPALSFDAEVVKGKVLNFIKDRFKNILLSTGISQEVIESVIALDFSYLHQIDRKIKALKDFRESFTEFETLVTSFKRISNITKGFTASGAVNPEMFQDTSERELWQSFQAVAGHVQKKIDQENYLDALNLLGQLSGPVDTFFSEVMVMAKDAEVKENRLTLLSQLKECFLQVADFSKFAI